MFVALVGLVATVAAFATDGRPGWSAFAMAAVATFTSLAAGAGPLGAAVGFLGSLGYMLVAVLARLANLTSVVSLGSAVSHIAIGCGAGLLVALADTGWRTRAAPDAAKATIPPSPLRPMWTSLRHFDRRARDGIRRAIPLAAGMFLFQRTGGRDAFWIFLAAYIVLLPTGKSPATVAFARVVSTVVGVGLLGLASLAVPDPLLFACGAGALLAGIAYGQRYPLVAGGLTAMGAVLLAGAPTGAVGHWAAHRLFDTVVGAGLALAATILLWPRDRPDAAATGALHRRRNAPRPVGS